MNKARSNLFNRFMDEMVRESMGDQMEKGGIERDRERKSRTKYHNNKEKLYDIPDEGKMKKEVREKTKHVKRTK